MISFRSTIAIALASGLALSACSSDKKDDEGSTTPAAEEPAPETKTAEPTEDSAGATEAVESLMASYDRCRALLADDEGEGIAACAKALSDAATAGKDAVPDAARSHMEALAGAADELASADSSDLEALRMAFGDVSESLVAVLAATPGAADAFHVFECPMAKGYKRWAQLEPKMANPYMGTKMLECGSEVEDL